MKEVNLEKYMFPVDEREVYYNGLSMIADTGNVYAETDKYKAVVRQDNNSLISVMKETYNIIPNSDIIKPLLDELSMFDSKWYVDPSHSFVEDNKMRLQVTFPELKLNDGDSDIALSLYLSNSYDGSEGVRMLWGAIRHVCTNGMVFGKVLGKFYGKHTQGFSIKNLHKQIEDTYNKIPLIQEKIYNLQSLLVTTELMEQIKKNLGKKVYDYCNEKSVQNQWLLYNQITYYISHVMKQKMMATYQERTSNVFKF